MVDQHQIARRLEGRLPTIGVRRWHEAWQKVDPSTNLWANHVPDPLEHHEEGIQIALKPLSADPRWPWIICLVICNNYALRKQKLFNNTGMEPGLPGTTAGPGVTNLMQMKCIGGGWDIMHITISKLILRHLLPRTLEAHVGVYLVQFDHQGLTREENTDGNEMMMLMNNQPDEFDKNINDLSSIRLQGYCIALGTHDDVICTSQVSIYEEGSVIDSGAARHIHPDVVVKDSDNLHRLASFTGETS